MPSRRAGEDRDVFVQRCMSDPEAKRDFPDPRQRFGFCSTRADQGRSQNEEVKGEDVFIRMIEDEEPTVLSSVDK